MTDDEPLRYAVDTPDANLPGDELEQVLQRRRSPWHRLLLGIGMMLAITFVVAFLWNGRLWDNQASATLPAAEAYVQLRTLVTQGKLTINDTTFPFSTGQKYPLIRGGNLLTLVGAPLSEPKWCVIYWPDLKTSPYTCKHSRISADHRLVIAELGDSLAEVDPVLIEGLQTETPAALQQAAQVYRAPVTIPAGTYVSIGVNPRSQLPIVGPARTHRDLSLQINIGNFSDSSGTFGCTSPQCDGSYSNAGSTPLPISVEWLVSSQGLTIANYDAPTGTPFPFAIRFANNALQLAIPAGQPGYPSLDAYIRARIMTDICLDPARPLMQFTGNSSPVFTAVQTGPTGCTFRLAHGTGSGTPSGDAGAYVVRFGVILAALPRHTSCFQACLSRHLRISPPSTVRYSRESP